MGRRSQIQGVGLMCVGQFNNLYIHCEKLTAEFMTSSDAFITNTKGRLRHQLFEGTEKLFENI